MIFLLYARGLFSYRSSGSAWVMKFFCLLMELRLRTKEFLYADYQRYTMSYTYMLFNVLERSGLRMMFRDASRDRNVRSDNLKFDCVWK